MGLDGVLIGGRRSGGFRLSLIRMGSVEIRVLIGVYGDRVLIARVSFRWGFDRADFSGGRVASWW